MKKKIAIIGGGAAALAVASFLDGEQFDIHLFEKNKALGRKFLVAGKGGFNLTHSEQIEHLLERYTPNTFLTKALHSFTNEDFRVWLASIGIPTFIGSSHRVYPEKGIKPIEVLQSIGKVISANGVILHFDKTWTGWKNENTVVFEDGMLFEAEHIIFALGGASWKVTGSDGKWKSAFKNKGIEITPFEPSNCAFTIQWPKQLIKKHAGSPLKNIAIRCGNKTQKGEAVITKTGLEGNAIYALSPQIRAQLNEGPAEIFIDFKPRQSAEELFKKLESSPNKSTTWLLKNKINLSTAQIDLIKAITSKEEFTNHFSLAQFIKNVLLKIVDTAIIDKSISTVGGIALDQVTTDFELKKLKQNYCIGEMLDWDAPTGGYLLQACFSMGYSLSSTLNNSTKC